MKFKLLNEQLSKKEIVDLINKYNPKDYDINSSATWITTEEDIKTYAEAVEDDETLQTGITPDFTGKDIQNALNTGTITVYSTHPIGTGTFVTPSKMLAETYGVTDKLHSKVISLDDVAWIDSFEGQYVGDVKNLTEGIKQESSMTMDMWVCDTEYSVRDLLKNKPKEYRILYDSNIELYFITDAYDSVHQDMIDLAFEHGYYSKYYNDDSEKDIYSIIDEYIERGTDEYLSYLIFNPDGDKIEDYILDGYDIDYKYTFGHIYSRGNNFWWVPLYKLIEKDLIKARDIG